MITLDHYFRNKRTLYASEYQVSFEHDALLLLDLVNQVIEAAVMQGVQTYTNETGDLCRSGWRPPSYNARVPKASKNSLHMVCKAIDVEDPQHGLSTFLFDDYNRNKNQSILVKVGVWCEHPNATPTWCHMQSLPPGSNNRFFFP